MRSPHAMAVDSMRGMNGNLRNRIAKWTPFVVLAASLVHTEAAVAQDASKAEANAHFEKRVAAVRVKRLVDAIEEFELAYKISPAFQVLYNIGQVNAALDSLQDSIDHVRTVIVPRNTP